MCCYKAGIVFLRYFSWLLFVSFIGALPEQCALTYKCNGGRLGDNIVTYSTAKLLSHKNKLPLFFTSFPYSEQLAMSQLETDVKHIDKKIFKETVKVSSAVDLENHLASIKDNVLFVSNYYTKVHLNESFSSQNSIYLETVCNKDFGMEIKKMLQPLIPIEKFVVPQDKITVAVHVRTGVGFDAPRRSKQYFDGSESCVSYTLVNAKNPSQQTIVPAKVVLPEVKYRKKAADATWPTKFPPNQYYIDQIKKLSQLLNDVPLFVYIFTDDPNPQQILEEFEKHVKKNNIVFATRTTKNAHNINVLEDCYALAEFDCLIRASSNFSWVSQLIGHHKIIISPAHATWASLDKLVIDNVYIFFRGFDEDNPRRFLFRELENVVW